MQSRRKISIVPKIGSSWLYVSLRANHSLIHFEAWRHNGSNVFVYCFTTPPDAMFNGFFILMLSHKIRQFDCREIDTPNARIPLNGLFNVIPILAKIYLEDL